MIFSNDEEDILVDDLSTRHETTRETTAASWRDNDIMWFYQRKKRDFDSFTMAI